MAYYVFQTERCKQDAKNHGVNNEVDKFAQKLEQDQSTRGLARFPPPYLKKSIGRPGRLVIEEYLKGTDVVLCLARYFIRGSSEYDGFCSNPANYYERNKVPEEEIEEFLEERKKKPVAAKAALSGPEFAYLQPTSTPHYTGDGAYLESYDWFERVSKDWAKNSLTRYYELIEVGRLPDEETIVTHDKNANIRILYKYFADVGRTFLIAPIDRKNPNDEHDLRKKYNKILNLRNFDPEELIRSSRRAYPSIIACDEDIWIQVQYSNEANLALSPEEEQVLESVLNPSDEGPKYPLFINGRPGSGKSTILQYLFSEHLERYIKLNGNDDSVSNPPLYLTYSRQLLEQARSTTENILRCGSKALQEGEGLAVDSDLLNGSFRNFREFLLDQLPSKERNKFEQSKYVHFEWFRKEWEVKRRSHPAKEVRDIGPELAWHAIRTFIKGMQDEFGSGVDPGFYKTELARDSKSVSESAFKSIYENVWENWYQPLCREGGYWDDQDLVWSVLNHSTECLSRYPVVFCDEAQDFTNIELELIERLSLYSNRDLPYYLAKRVPFAFAGDPFQTLNPTGFNWSAMQASFHNNIAQQLDGSGKLEFNFQELFFNYRSSEQIVKLANLIQLLRAVLLDIKRLRPQQCWARREVANPVWFRHDDANCNGKIREQDELVIIVPCQENGELEYIREDPFLSNFALKNGQISRNILSPARAKGLEYDRVLLYRFGDAAGKQVPELFRYIQQPSSDAPKVEQRLEWEYFLNQFYVAVSRARKRLFIVDSEESLRNFWKFAEKQTELLELYRRDGEWKREDIGGIAQGDETSWSADRDNPLDLAKHWKEQGLAQRDPYQLYLAKSNFERAERPEEAKLCEAQACEFEGEFAKAADLFQRLRQPDEACRCYWAGKNLDAVVNLGQQFPEIEQDPRFVAAKTIAGDNIEAGQLQLLLKILKNAEDSAVEMDWRWFFVKAVPMVCQAVELSGQGNPDWKPLIEEIDRFLRRLSISSNDCPDIGKLYYFVGEWETAVERWEECSSDGRNEPEWVTRARAKKEPFPKNILYLDRIGDHDAVVEAWRVANSEVSARTPVNQILKSATEVSDLEAIRTLLPTCNDLSRILAAIQLQGDEAIAELKGAVPIGIANCLEKGGKWRELIEFATKQSTHDKQVNSSLTALRVHWSQAATIAAVVRILARSENLIGDNAKSSQQKISEFLKQYLIVNNNSRQRQKALMDEVHQLISVAEVGAAFERAFRLTFALEYYEQWFVNKKLFARSPEIERFAKKRWLMCKYRLGEVEGGARGDRHIHEAEQKVQEWRLSLDSEYVYPNLGDAISLDVSSPDVSSPRQEAQAEFSKSGETPNRKEFAVPDVSVKAQVTIGDLNLDVIVFTKKQRIVLTRTDTEDQVNCGPWEATSEDVSMEKTTDEKDLKGWLIKEWGICCEIQFCDTSSILRLKRDDSSILGFEIPGVPKKG